MLEVKVGNWAEANQKLRSVGVRPFISHRQNTFVSMWVPNLLIIESFTVDAGSSSPILVCNVSSLSHYAFHYSMENVTLIVQRGTFVSNTDLSEIF